MVAMVVNVPVKRVTHNTNYLYIRARSSNLTHMSLRHMTVYAYWRELNGGERAAGQGVLSNLSRHSCEMIQL